MKSALLISCFDWYDLRLKYIANYLIEHNYEVKILTSNFNHILKSKIDVKEIDNVSNNNITYIQVPEYKKNVSLPRIISHYVFSYKIYCRVKKIKPDFVYCLIPPNFLAYFVSKLKKKLSFTLVYDIIDLWPESFPIAKRFNYFFKLWKRLRDGGLKQCDKVVLECDYYREQIEKIVPKNKISTWLLVKKSYIDELNYFGEWDKHYLVLGYLGSINDLIDIDEIVKVIQDFSKFKHIKVEIIGTGYKKNEFIKRLIQIGAVVNDNGIVYEESEKKKILSKCDFGINIYKTNVNIGFTMKSLDYLSYGLPLLNSIKGDTYNFVEKYNIGINIASLSAIDRISFNNIVSNEIDMRKNVQLFFNQFLNEQTVNDRLDFLDEYI